MPQQHVVLRRFGENVRTRRREKTLSQEDLAEEADLDRTYIGGVERGERNPTLLSITRIAKALGTTAAVLCQGVDR